MGHQRPAAGTGRGTIRLFHAMRPCLHWGWRTRVWQGKIGQEKIRENRPDTQLARSRRVTRSRRGSRPWLQQNSLRVATQWPGVTGPSPPRPNAFGTGHQAGDTSIHHFSEEGRRIRILLLVLGAGPLVAVSTVFKIARLQAADGALFLAGLFVRR